MPSPDHMTALAERIVPIMQDHGLSAFVITGYAEDGDGNLRRVLITNTAKNAAFEDGLLPVIQFAHMWSRDPKRAASDQQSDANGAG